MFSDHPNVSAYIGLFLNSFGLLGIRINSTIKTGRHSCLSNNLTVVDAVNKTVIPHVYDQNGPRYR
jgi:hypothetical protein